MACKLFQTHRLVKTIIIDTKPYQRHPLPKTKNQQLLMSDNKHQKTYMHKTSELLAKNNNFQSVQEIFHSMREIAKQCFSEKQAKLKPWSNHQDLAAMSIKQKATWLKMRSLMKYSDQYIKLKDIRKKEIRAFKKSARSHCERWLDSQFLEIEKAPDDTKMFEAVKLLRPQKTNKLLVK